MAKAQALEGQKRTREARECYTKCLDVTPELAFQLIKVGVVTDQVEISPKYQALRAEQVDYVVAPYEADAQLCFLEREGFVDGIITEDSDLLVFGCRRVRWGLVDHLMGSFVTAGHFQARWVGTMRVDQPRPIRQYHRVPNARLDRPAVPPHGCGWCRVRIRG